MGPDLVRPLRSLFDAGDKVNGRRPASFSRYLPKSGNEFAGHWNASHRGAHQHEQERQNRVDVYWTESAAFNSLFKHRPEFR